MTFNINETTAQRIDDLNLSNRSEWANQALLDIMDGRLAQRQDLLDKHNDATREAIQDDLLKQLGEDPHRMTVLLFSALQRAGLDDYKIKGRFTIGEQLLVAINTQAFKDRLE